MVMAGKYDAILDEEQGSAPTSGTNRYDSVLDQEVQSQQQATRTVFERALAINPDQAANSKKLMNTTGLPLAVVERNLDEVKRKEQARMLDLAQMAQDSPVLSRQMLDPAFTNQTHDHLDSLSALEQTFNVARSIPAGAARGIGGLVAGSGELIDIGARATGLTAVSRAVKDLTGADLGVALDVAGSLKFAGSGWKMLADAIGAAPEDKNFATDVGEGIGQLVQQVGVQIATGGTASLVSLFSQGADAMASKTGKDNSSQALKDTAVLAGASITALTEKYGVDALLNRVPPAIKNNALRWVADKLVAGGIEATQEVTEGVLQDVVRKLLTNSDAKIGEGVAYEAGVAGTSAAIVRAALGVRVRSNVEIQRGLEAEQHAEQLKAQFQLASQALLRERNPDEFRTLMQSMADQTDGASREVYIDAEVLNQLAPELLAQLPESVRAALPDALAANDVVAIPVGDVLTLAPGTPLEAMLVEHARIGDVRAMSQAEAKDAGAKAQEFLAQESQRVIAQAVDQQAMQDSSDRVKQGVLDQLTTVGRFRKDVNEAYATWTAAFYTTMAGRMGVTPEQMQAQYPLKIAGQSSQGETLKAGKVGEIAVEGFHFSKDDRSYVSTSMYGTGLQGSNREAFQNATDKRLGKRSYFYADTGTGINPESGVGGRGHKAQLTNVYDSNSDPLRLKGGSQQDFESKVLDAGFSGYLDRMSGTQSGQVIMLGDQNIAVEALGAMGNTQGQRVAPATARESKGRDVVVDALNANKSLPAGFMPLQSWSDMLAKTMPEVHAALASAGVFDGGGSAYKSELIKAFQNATPAESYAQSLSSRLPSAVKATEDPLANVLNITFDVVLSDTKTLAKNVTALQALPNMRKLTGKGAKDPVKNVEAFIEHVTNNLLWLHDHMPATMRDRARQWYDGGRKTVEAWANRYGISEMQGAAAIAVLSPQNGWFANVSQAERIADMVFGLREYVWDDAMTAEATRISSEDGLDPRMQAAVGKTLGELLATPDIAARWARVYDQAHNNRAYRVLTPEGGAAEYVKTGAGNDATMMWKSYSTIAKAISVFMDGRAENVYYQIGKEHKVRNFYNNLFAPKSALGFATIDTHAVAAALLRPLASADIEVDQAFGGGGSSSSAVTGLNGTYPIYLEAYRRAAEARGILPREMQSITWEAVRGLFEAAKKSGLKKPANAIWARYKAGEIEQEQAQKEILALAGDITPPSWTSVPFNDTPSRTYEGPAQGVIDARGDVGVSATPSAKVMFEVAPDPNDAALTTEWNALSSEERLRISQEVAAKVVPKVLKELGTDGDFVMQLGGYMGATNPSMTLRLSRPELSLTAAKLLGHTLSQDSMMVVTERQTLGADPVGVVTITLPDGYGETEISALYDKLWELEQDSQKLIGGHTTADGQMVILNYSGLEDAELARLVDEQLGGEFPVAIDTVYSAFPSKEDYGYGSNGQEGATPAGQSPAQRRPSDLRGEATQLLREALDARRAAAQAGEVNGRLEQAGNGSGRSAGTGSAPLPGAPVVAGATGPDARLVAVAEQYALDNGIDLKRQAEYVQVDAERGARIAQAYAEMAHAPQDPAVKEAYENLIRQTTAQYKALEAAGYKFWFIDPANDPYKSPFDAMREMRASQTMGVFPTVAGFGSGATDADLTGNPLEADTGITWPYGSPDGELKPVLANDLFRAVHDAFGHGLEGAGFRAQGEENAWQAHSRLFTGSAVGAITSETRGQNSWLNFGPNGEANQTAKVEDTVFADQKTGLMPEWTWTEGRAGDQPAAQGDAFYKGEDGKPLTVYHGGLVWNKADLGTAGRDALWLTDEVSVASGYADQYSKGDGREIKAFNLRMQNPLDLRDPAALTLVFGEDNEPAPHKIARDRALVEEALAYAKANGHDGLIHPDSDVFNRYTNGRVSYAVFNAAQLSLAPLKGGEQDGNTYDIPMRGADTLAQGPRGTFNPKTLELALNENADLSTFLHETGHFFLEVMADLASQPGAPADITADMDALVKWFGVADTATWNAMSLDQKRPYHERFAESMEQYLLEGKAPSLELQPLFRKFRAWMLNVYKSLKAFIDSRVAVTSGGGELAQAPQTDAFAKWFGDSKVVDAAGKPLVVYHGTRSDFSVFSGKDGFNFFAETPEGASVYGNGTGASIYPVYLNITKPLDLGDVDLGDEYTKAKAAKILKVPEYLLPNPKFGKKGHLWEYFDKGSRGYLASLYDGIKANEDGNEVYVAFNPTQIKSATGNNGTFDGTDPNILNQGDQPTGPNIQLSDEVRQVFDRMLASEEQIAQANEVAGLLPNEDADASAVEKLTARSLRDLKWTVNARAKAIKALQKQAASLRKEVEAEVTAEVNAMPEFQAKEMLDKTRKENKEQLNDTELAIIADAFQYPDVQSMLQAIDAAGKKSDVIEGMTDQRMLERHGDLIDQRAIEQAANEAVHNEARARSLATELRSQAEMLNPRTDTGEVNAKGSKITVNAIVEAAKQFAANVIARTPLRDLKAKAWQHTAAERRAGKRWQEATAAGKTQDAVKAKQDQVLNNAAAKAAMDAQVEMRKILEFFKRVIKDNNEKVVDKGRDPDVVNAARAVLAAYGVAPKAGKNALEYMALVEKNDPAMYAALQPSVQGALNMAQPLDALTMEELRGLHEEIQGMWHLAKRSRQMEVDGNMMDMQDAEDELQARMQTIGVPLTMPGDTGAVTPREEMARKLQFVGSILRRTEQWAQGMGSEFTRLVFQPVKDAADRYRADRVTYRKAYQALVDNVAPALTKGLIEAPELGYTFGKGHNGIGHAELLHAILHTGNASNKRKLLLGRGWATENADGTVNTDRWDAFLQRMHDTGVLNKAHYDFAQGVWDLLEKTKPLAQKTHRDVFGRYFAEVTADSFDTPFGSYAGGYVPAQADPRIVQDADLRKLAESENENMAFSFPGTNKGFTKGRVEYNRPLMLDLRTIGQHLDKVLLFAHMEPAVRDVNKLLSRKGVSYSLGRIDPTIYAGMLTPWLNRSARQVVETPIVGDGGISRVLSAARSRAGMALMFANVSNTLQQLTGFSLAALKVKPASMMAATAQFVASPKKTAKAVSDASAFMASRMENEISAINDAMDAILLDPSVYEKAQAWSQKHAYFLQTAMANTMEPIIWTAAYNDALTEGQSERDAVRYADNVIRTTQGSTLPEDVSRIETGPAYARVFTQFIGYFNMMANTNATALKQISQEMGLKKGAGKAIGVVTLGFLAPIWVAEAIAQAMRGGPDDEDKDGYLDDWLAAVFGMGTIKGSLAMVPFVGQLANAAINRFNGNPADDKMSLSPAVSLLESAVGVPVDIYKAITDPDKLNKRNAVRDVASAVSIATGLPAIAIARPLGYLAGVADNKIDPTGPVDAVRGAITGTPSPASK